MKPVDVPVRVAVCGYQGRLGAAAVEAVRVAPGLVYVGGVGPDDCWSTFAEAQQPEVVVDATGPHCVLEHLQRYLALGIRPVVGTTGLTDEGLAACQAMAEARGLGGVVAPNFSLAVALMERALVDMAPWMLDASVVETHHLDKRDAPSGTARRAARLIAGARRQQGAQQHASEALVPGCLGGDVDGVPVHALRHAGVIADQTVTFSGVGETLTLQHRTLNHTCFQAGLRLACERVMTLDRLVVGLGALLPDRPGQLTT